MATTHGLISTVPLDPTKFVSMRGPGPILAVLPEAENENRTLQFGRYLSQGKRYYDTKERC